MSERTELLQRLDAVEARLAARATRTVPAGTRTAPDPGSGERWEAGQVWAHLAEFIPYWIEQARRVAGGYVDEPVPFGRTKSDQGRLAAIERDRDQPVAVLWSDTHADLETLRRFIEGMDERSLSARGVHPTRGVMPVDRILDEFLVGHLEEHADQLDELARNATSD
jgi:hypothetical protein